MTQTRWFCQACEREWVAAIGWDESRCPAPDCLAPSPTRVTYQAEPGLDMPRTPVSPIPAPVLRFALRDALEPGRRSSIPEFD